MFSNSPTAMQNITSDPSFGAEGRERSGTFVFVLRKFTEIPSAMKNSHIFPGERNTPNPRFREG